MIQTKESIAQLVARLADAPPILKLPMLLHGPETRASVEQDAVETTSFRLSTSLSSRLCQLSESTAMSLPPLICAAWATVLFRYSEQQDILLGFLTDQPDDRLTNEPQVLRLNLNGNPPFATLLEQTQQVMDEAKERPVPLGALVGALPTVASDAHHPLIQAGFTWRTDAYRPSAGTPVLDVQLVLQDTGEAIVGQWLYRPDYIDTETILRMSGHLETLLAGIVADIQTPIAQLPLLTDTERQMMLVEWNNTTVDHPLDQCVHEIFAQHAADSPNHVAVTYDGEQLSYCELNARVNQMAHYLLAEGVQPGDLIGVFVERSTDVVVLMLAVFKVGGVYLPLDPTYPPDRLAFMLEDTGASLLLTREKWLENIPAQRADNPVKIVSLETVQDAIAAQSIDNPAKLASSDQLAYVIYTSGSTGKPKGVMVEHRSLTNVVMNDVRLLQLSPADRLTQFFSLSFDASITEILCPLCGGSRLYVLTEEQVLHGPALIELLKSEAITHLFLTPSVLATLSDVSPAEFPALKALFAAGEACTPDLVKRWSTGRTFYNVYGPTEFAIAATIGECTPADVPPPIGRIYDNCQAYVLDQQMQPVPIGVTGELYLGGVQVARGYLNRPELTDEKFVPNPFGPEENPEKLYKTGDLVTYRADGKIVFVGREDGMVKVRGLRIEVGEIEAVLNDHPAVRQAVVEPSKDASGRAQHLVGYVVPLSPDQNNGNGQLTSAVLNRFASQTLPAFMTPSAFVMLSELPLTPSGKVDRKALPTPDMDSLDRTGRADLTLPRTETETAIANIWADLLGLEQIGVHENFFELGGHSVLATQIASRLKEQFTLVVPIRVLFEQHTIAELAEWVDMETLTQADDDLLAALLSQIEAA